jgi:hypothetical protein
MESLEKNWMSLILMRYFDSCLSFVSGSDDIVGIR